MNRFSRPFRFFSASAVCGALVLGTGAPDVPAAPTLDAQDKRVSERLALLLHQNIKQPNGSKIKLVVSPTARASEGYFSQIHMSGAPVQLRQKLRISEFSLDARNVRVDVVSLWGANKVRTLQSQTTLRAVITEDDLTQLLARGKRSKGMNLKVKYLGNQMRVTGNLNYPLLSGPVVGVGTLRLMPGHKVHLDITSLKLRGVETPAFVKNQLMGHVNPVIEYQDLPFNPPFKSVKVVGNKAILST
ncbi:MAG: DUF2993 domain-containing protein [Armatimonadetes bacterium]|nr:DUF2993 domain-containing protein [Armatimonadota bacterium]